MPGVEMALARVDDVRARAVRLLGPLARPLLVDREARVAWLGVSLVAVAFGLVGVLPMWVLALGPIVWGVPHVAADVRYLVTRPGYHRRVLVGVPAALGMIAAYAGCGLAAVLAGAAVSVLLSRGSLSRRLVVTAPLVLLAFFCARAPSFSTLVFAHVHNAIAVLFFALWRRRRGNAHLFVLAASVLGTLAIGAGTFDRVADRATALGSVTFDDLSDELAPPELIGRFGSDPHWPGRLVLLYAFGQSVHYVVWLRLVPEEDRPSPTPRSFRQSWRALRRDLGLVFLLTCAVVAIGVAIWAAHDLATARFRYLQLAFFHGWLELAAGAVMLAEGRRVVASSAPAVAR